MSAPVINKGTSVLVMNKGRSVSVIHKISQEVEDGVWPSADRETGPLPQRMRRINS